MYRCTLWCVDVCNSSTSLGVCFAAGCATCEALGWNAAGVGVPSVRDEKNIRRTFRPTFSAFPPLIHCLSLFSLPFAGVRRVGRRLHLRGYHRLPSCRVCVHGHWCAALPFLVFQPPFLVIALSISCRSLPCPVRVLPPPFLVFAQPFTACPCVPTALQVRGSAPPAS